MLNFRAFNFRISAAQIPILKGSRRRFSYLCFVLSIPDPRAGAMKSTWVNGDNTYGLSMPFIK